VAYAGWIQQRVRDRCWLYPALPEQCQPSIDVLTLVYNTDPATLLSTSASVRAQDYHRYRWILWDNGSTRPDTRQVLEQLRQADNVEVYQSDENLGITVGHAHALERCRGDYVALLDHDDQLYPDALRVVAFYIALHEEPALLYSDEDKMDAAGRPFSPYFKPDWSPGLIQSTGYTCHLNVFRRQCAVQLGAFSDRTVEGAQDWDLVLRFLDAVHTAVHIPEVLYSWRILPESTAGRGAAAKPYVLDGQRSCLEASLRRRRLQHCFRIRSNVLFRGLEGHWHLQRLDTALPPVDRVLVQPSLAAARRLLYENEELRPCPGRTWSIFPPGRGNDPWQIIELERDGSTLAEIREVDTLAGALNRWLLAGTAEYCACVPPGIVGLAPDWLREGIGQLELNPQAALVGGRVLDAADRLVAGPAILGLGGVVGTPNRGESSYHMDEFGLTLDSHNVSAIHRVPWIARREVLARMRLDEIFFPEEYTEIDLCLRLLAAGWQILYNPHLVGKIAELEANAPSSPGAADEARWLLQRHGDWITDDPYYSPFLSLRPERAYQLAGAEDRRRSVLAWQRRLSEDTTPGDGYDLARRTRGGAGVQVFTSGLGRRALGHSTLQRSIP
jgi:glycosyltransferase involved in cell wall biosynthesis